MGGENEIIGTYMVKQNNFYDVEIHKSVYLVPGLDFSPK